MRWSFTVPGQPVSWDRAYRSGRMPVQRKGQAVLREDGSQKYITRPVKTPEGQQWQDDVYRIAITARPSRWRPGPCTHGSKPPVPCTAPQLRVVAELLLSHDMDDDNALKLARDALAKAIGYDDIHFLVCTMSKEVSGDPRRAQLTLTIDDVVDHDIPR